MENQSVNFSIEVSRAQLRAALIFAADKDIRYYLNGVCLHVGECGDARLVATDGHRLCLISLGDCAGAVPGEYLIPRDVLKPIKKAGRHDYPLLLKIEAGRVQIEDQAEKSIISGAPLIDGKFPDFARVIPKPEDMSGAASAFNAAYLADVQKALIELGDKMGLFSILQDGENQRGLIVRPDRGFLAVIMGIRDDMTRPTAADVAQFMPRPMPRAIVETAAGGQAFPFDAAQFEQLTDRTRPAACEDSAPAVVAHCGAEFAAAFDPSGALQAAGLLVVAHVGDAAPETRQPEAVDAEYMQYLASLQAAA